MLYQEYGIIGKAILSKLMSTLTNEKSFIYDFSILFNFVSSLVTEETYYVPPWSSSKFVLWILFGLTQAEKVLLSCEECLFHSILFILSPVQLLFGYHSPLLHPNVNWTHFIIRFGEQIFLSNVLNKTSIKSWYDNKQSHVLYKQMFLSNNSHVNVYRVNF